MYQDKKLLALITARGGSKSIPRKNIVPLGGKPLIAWSIEAALGSKLLDRVILSSEDEEIISVATEYGCDVPFIRDAELAADDTPGILPVLDALDRCPGYDYLLQLQPTSPFRTAEDVDGIIRFCLDAGARAAVSVMPAEKHPAWMYYMGAGGRLEPAVDDLDRTARRQDLPEAFALNGALYFGDIEFVRENRSYVADGTIGYVMPPERSIDIDDDFDLELAEFILRRGEGDDHQA